MTAGIFGASERAYGLVATAVQTAAYAAAAQDLVLVDTTAAARVVTLPSAPFDQAPVAVKIVAGANGVTVNTSGTDVFDVAGGAATMNWTTLYQSAVYQYVAASGVWVRVAAYGASGGGGSVSSVFGRTGAVVATSGDYSFGQLSGSATAGQLPSLDALTAPAAAVSMNTHNITHLVAGVASTDAVNVSQLPSATTPLAIGSGGTGQTGATAAFNGLSPTTTLGDVLSNDGTNDVRVAGNTTATRKFLRQTGTGAVSALPAWDTLVAADVPTLNQNTSGTAAGLSATLAVASGGTGSTTQNFVDVTTAQSVGGVKTFTSRPVLPAPPSYSAFAPVTSTGSTTITGVSVLTALASGLTVPASGLAAGQVYTFKAWGALTTTLAAQTFTLALYWGGIAGTQLITFGAAQPNSGGTETGASWMVQYEIVANTATSISVTGFDGLAYFFNSQTNAVTTVANSSSEQFAIGVTPSAAACSITCSGFYCVRLA